jgi:effector-binding domain-containing protein
MLVASIRSAISAHVDVEELELELLAGVRMVAPPVRRGTLWHACGHGSAGLDAEVFLEVDARTTHVSGRVQLSELPAITAACAPATDDDGAEATFVALHRWVEREQCTITGPKRELRWAAPLEPSVPDVLLEVQFPCAHRRTAFPA